MVSFSENHKEFIKNKSQRFRNVFTEEFNKILLSANNDKRIKLVDSVETYTYGINEEIIHRKKEIKCNNIMKKYEK